MKNIYKEILKRHPPTGVRIVIKQILCEKHDIHGHIVPEPIEIEVDNIMRKIYNE